MFRLLVVSICLFACFAESKKEINLVSIECKRRDDDYQKRREEKRRKGERIETMNWVVKVEVRVSMEAMV